MTKTRKIDVYKDGEYIYSTDRYSTLKMAINEAVMRKTVFVASIPVKQIDTSDRSRLKAFFS